LREFAEVIRQMDGKRSSSFSDGWYGALTAACRSGLSIEEIQEIENLLADPLGPLGHQGDPGWPEHYLGAKAELAGDLDEAITHYTKATTVPGWRRSVPAQADALLGLARCQLATGDLLAAHESASLSMGQLQNWRGWRRNEVEALLHRLVGTGSSDSEGPLTPRELEVVALVAQGKTNGEIGKLLFISTKTASVHVSSVLRKLALSNRSEIAAWAVRHDIAGTAPETGNQ
jgi:DNA-binding CsgD family transcriptional regulator